MLQPLLYLIYISLFDIAYPISPRKSTTKYLTKYPIETNIEERRTRLIDIYMSGDIDQEEFSAARSKCDAKIAELQSAIDSIGEQQAMAGQQELIEEIGEAIEEIVGGVEYEDELYKQLLDKMVVNDRDNIDVYLNMLPFKWSYTIVKTSKKR